MGGFLSQLNTLESELNTGALTQTLTIDNLPTFVDWSQQGAVTSIKYQQQCAACYAFAATAAFESAYFIAGGKLTDFSNQ